jgi:hypothetical protein
MKTTRIEIEGRAGHYATVSRKGDGRTIDIEVLTPDRPDGFIFRANPTIDASQRLAAAWLHKALEGYEGTAGDILEYLRLIQTFAD